MSNSPLLLGTVLAATLSLAALAAGAASAAGSVLERSLSRAWDGADGVRYAEPGDDPGWVRTQALFARLLRGERGAELAREARSLGWQLRRGRIGATRWTVLAEQRERRSGRGLYAFASSGRHAIQAPHVPTDRFTGEIALALGREGRPRAIAWNTVPRGEADLPHLADSPLHAFSRAYAAAYPRERIVQLHGFDAGRPSHAGREAILSASQERPAADVQALAACLRERVEPETGLYGVDAHALGGTTNRIARMLLAGGYAGFVHLEMGLPLRKSLRDDPQRRAALLDCLGVPR